MNVNAFRPATVARPRTPRVSFFPMAVDCLLVRRGRRKPSATAYLKVFVRARRNAFSDASMSAGSVTVVASRRMRGVA